MQASYTGKAYCILGLIGLINRVCTIIQSMLYMWLLVIIGCMPCAAHVVLGCVLCMLGIHNNTSAYTTQCHVYQLHHD